MTKISISEKICNDYNVHPAMRREKKIIIHDGWQWHMGSVDTEEQLKEMLNFFEMELTTIEQVIKHETTGEIKFYNVSKNIVNHKVSFWNMEQLREMSNNATLKVIKGLSNGSIVDCYAEIRENEIIIYRPNPNAKEVYKEMELEKELNFRRNNWYI